MATVTKKDLVDAIAVETGLTKSDVHAVLSALPNAITKALVNGDKVQLADLAVISVKDRAARTGRNPKTGEQLIIPAGKSVSFKAAKSLREAVK